MERSNFYKDTLPELLKKYKIVLKQCLEVIAQPIDSSITDDKLHSVLKSKRMAGEDVKYYAMEIQNLENDINGLEPTETETEKKNKKPRNIAQEMAS